MSEKKVVGRNIAIALGIICIILAVGLIVVIFVSYSPTSNSLQNQVNSLQTQVTNLQNQVNDLTNTLNLGKSTVWVNDQTVSQPASSYTVWTLSASYAGYVSVWIQSSSVSGTHVKAIYSSNGVDFNQEIVVSAGNTANFPILPSSSIQIEVGNGNLINGATETVTITYYY